MVLSMDKWNGKIAIVTGASAGIGAAIAQRLVEHGLKVVGLARRPEKVEELSNKLANQPGTLYPLKADITKEADIINAFEWTTKHLGPVSILINNAGIYRHVHLTSGKTQDFKDVFDTNVLGLCLATREAAKIFMEHKINGHIIHISSIAAHTVFMNGCSAYCASKYAVKALTEGLRIEFREIGSKSKITPCEIPMQLTAKRQYIQESSIVQEESISPGAVDTEILADSGFDTNTLTAERPVLQAEDVVDSVLYVLSTPPHVQVHEIIIKPVGEAI